jgi:hypothetical protein
MPFAVMCRLPFACAATTEAHHAIFNNPFMGMAWVVQPEDPQLRQSCWRARYAFSLMQIAATSGHTHATILRVGLDDKSPDVAMRVTVGKAPCEPLDTESNAAVQHLTTVLELLKAGANPRAETVPHLDTPLMLAAAVENAAVVDMLCRKGADTEHRRWVPRAFGLLCRGQHSLLCGERNQHWPWGQECIGNG